MKKLLAVINKELLILLRDIPALLFLFIMPAILIIVVSATEESIFNQNKITLLLVAPYSSEIKKDIETGLNKSNSFIIKNVPINDSLVVQNAKNEIAKGEYQVGIFIPTRAEQNIACRAEKLVGLSVTNPDVISDSMNSINGVANITILFDPAIKESLKNSIVNALKGLFAGTEIKTMVKKYSERLEEEIKLQFRAKMDSLKNKDISVDIPNFPMKDEINKQIRKKIENFANEDIHLKIPDFPWQSESLFKLSEEYAHNEQYAMIEPSVSQIRVPGFTLFAMFFIVIPLAGSIITERNEGTFDRLRTLPVSFFTLLSGKIIIYTIVCVLQFFFMLIIGLYILPKYFDMPALILGSHYFAILITALMSSLAAIGFGLLVGTLASSHAQASSFGSVIVVILGILGGAFIPVYMMPTMIKTVSIISPLRWGIDSFIELFVRNVGLFSIYSNIVKLFLFFTLSLAISSFSYFRRK